MNRAPVAKKVLQYLAHAEGICLSGGGKYRTYTLIIFLHIRHFY